MDSLADLQIVRVGKEISAVPNARGIVRPRCGDRATWARGRHSVEGDSARPASLDKVKVGGIVQEQERGSGCGIIGKCGARESNRKGIDHPRREDVRLLQAELLEIGRPSAAVRL